MQRLGLRRWCSDHRHTALLIATIAAFAVRPLLGDFGIGPIIYSIAMLVLLIVALYVIQVDELVGEREKLLRQNRRRTMIGWILAVPTVVFRIVPLFIRRPWVFFVGIAFWFFLFVFIAYSELRAVLRQKYVTGETISMAASVYLLMAFSWGLFYIFLDQAQPNAFHFTVLSSPRPEQTFPVLTYFSLTTISTIGYGDIIPLTLQARYAAVAEGIAGQFYLAILVARLVGLYMAKPSENKT